MDGAFGGGRYRIEADQRAGRHDDLATFRAGEIDQIGARQQRAGAQHHHLLAGVEHRPADLVEDRGRRAFDREIGVIGQFIERDQRNGNAFAIEPGLRLGAIPRRDARQHETRYPLRQLARHGFADLAQPGNGNAFGRQFAAPVMATLPDYSGTPPVSSITKVYLALPQFPARFSANDASPSDASAVCRRAECIFTSRA